jgi:hypothetical protein
VALPLGRATELGRFSPCPRGTSSASRLLYALILLKVDASETGPVWADERSADAHKRSPKAVAALVFRASALLRGGVRRSR